MRQETIKKLFERRPFTERERADMKDLYAHAELFALRMVQTIPSGVELELAVFKLKELLGLCETAVALNPKCEAQTEMHLKGSRENTMCGTTSADSPAYTRR